ncbi:MULTISPECIES: methyltransferase domain-containing protein [unclassified Solwaraspora]|uniref:methyltransferase domain-containing protein n=1 Tax=unclassified Solwaraspora TaxID=2627926 RepID=UPI00259B7575|nr:methyltransferase domain-containing protein [Solwaraspora sp. WMMA2056]WJK38969.1 methyltransferase domain-containing protein [Solwaraspora sp. WMMA2056]
MPTFDEYVAEATAVPVAGWDFTWFAGRATERRPSWGYSALLGERMAGARRAVDLQTGGGEVLATVAAPPPVLVATEGWPPNVEVARERLTPLGATVVHATEDEDLPFRDGVLDLVVSRHPTVVRWPEVARVLERGGTYLSQQIGPDSVGELRAALGVSVPPRTDQHPDRIRDAATGAGLDVVDLRMESLRMEFFDIAAVIVFLRKVVWTVPGFTVERYRDELAAVHRRIVADGVFVAHSRRVLVRARRR